MAQIIYGWLYGGDGHQLYVYEKPNGAWGVTDKKEEATAFPSVKACSDHYLSKHRIPEDYEQSTRNGYLKYFDLSTNQITLF